MRHKILSHILSALKISADTSLLNIPPARYRALLGGNRSFPGLIKLLEDISQQNKTGWNEYFSQFYIDTECPACGGSRLNSAALSVKINNKSIADLTAMTPANLASFFSAISFTDRQKQIAKPILMELLPKLELLKKAGLSYLTLNRSADTLSGGEAQRIRLSAQVASNLRGIAYVLDEPTIGLHPHDSKNLLKIVRDLQLKGNSIIIVEHDEETIKSADHIIDLGPGGGIHGGNIVASGTLQEITNNPKSLTGAYLSGKRSKSTIKHRPTDKCEYLRIIGAREHNLKDISACFPIGRLTVVTGISGSGKTTLVRDTLYKAARKALGSYHGHTGLHAEITGANHFKRIIEIDQSPIGKTPRSIPATYAGFYNDIRTLFSLLPDSRVRGYTPGRFSFNLRGGRCEKCSGQGKIKVAMSFLPDMYVDCDVCNGNRFNDETLQVLYKENNISQVLSKTVEEGCKFFKNIPAVYNALNILNKMGLGYLTLGQPSPTLSGGEAQRIKIAAELCKNSHGKTLYILDEPTTGLHFADVEKLMTILQSLVDLGNTMVIIEHNMEVISQADHIIDLGPGAGDQGGSIVLSGPPNDFAASDNSSSLTSEYLKEYLNKNSALPSEKRPWAQNIS